MVDNDDIVLQGNNPSTGIKDLVIETLKNVCQDVGAPAAAKAQAARTLAEISGLLGKYQSTPVEEETQGETLSESDLDKEINALRNRLKTKK